MWRHEPPDMKGITTHRLCSLTKEQSDLRTLGWSTRNIVWASRETLFCQHCVIALFCNRIEMKRKNIDIKYQIAIVTFEVEDFDGDDLVEGDAESAVDRSAYTLSNLLV